MGTEGDALFFVFTEAAAAVAGTLEAQRALLAHGWSPKADVRVRMGLHTGEAVESAGDFLGRAVHLASRICATGHGRQVLISQATRDSISSKLPEGASLRDLGPHVLKDLGQPQRIFQLCHECLPAEFPPLRSLSVLSHNLPVQLTSFVGRDTEKAEVARLLLAHRLVTLMGARGCGKTRLALQVGADLVADWRDGVWLVELAALSDAGLVPQAVASALGIREEQDRDVIATVEDFLRPKQLVVLLDNCEHVVEASAAVAERLLRTCPDLHVLATSREPLRVTGEATFRVPSLSCPDVGRAPEPEDLSRSEAVRLFLDRATLVRPGFRITVTNAPAVAQICQRLDGIPLALELAASRVSALSCEQIASRLGNRFELLTGGARTALPRHRTLRAAVDWSYDLLSRAERLLFHRISVFYGGFTLEAAEAVCAGDGLDASQVVNLLAGLVDRSLVVVDERAGELRYALLETLRDYGAEKLAASGEEELGRARHLQWFRALADQAGEELHGSNQKACLQALGHDRDNLRGALRRAVTGVRRDDALGLAIALSGFWLVLGHLHEGRAWLKEALSLPGDSTPVLHGRALLAAGTLAERQGDYAAAKELAVHSMMLARQAADRATLAQSLNVIASVAIAQGDYPSARSHAEQGLALLRELDDRRAAVWVLHNLGVVARALGDYTSARARFQESLALAREIGDRRGEAYQLGSLGVIARLEGDDANAAEAFEETLGIYRELDDRLGMAGALHASGMVALARGDHRTARTRFEESSAMQREAGSRWGIAALLDSMGALARAEGDAEEACRLHGEALAQRRELGDRPGLVQSLEALASAETLRGNFERATRLVGAADALRLAIGAPLPPSDRAGQERTLSLARAGLDEPAFRLAWDGGQAMSVDDILTYVRGG